MNVILFSRNGIHHNDSYRQDAVAVFVPSRDQIRRFSDIPSVNDKSVRDRYGDVGQMPLWRMEGNTVVVYGLLPEDLAERRHAIEVFLPEDFVPAGSSVFYYLFGDRWIVHGLRSITDDGAETWGISRFDIKGQDPVQAMVGAISERQVMGNRENICIAVHSNEDALQKLTDEMRPFDLEVVKFETLNVDKDKKPLYLHRDFGMALLVAAIFALLVCVASIGFALMTYNDTKTLDERIMELEAQIRKSQTSTKLGSIKNPTEILKALAKPLQQRPSAIMHAAGDVSTVFGQLQKLELDTEGDRVTTRAGRRNTTNSKSAKKEATIDVVATITSDGTSYLLVDQERVAKSALESRPWIRKLERMPSSGANNISLRIGVQVE
ncbi:MAG: hypothetical protein GC134_07250 [Proteobacteria bacterium]|nr:hypothetical protein [Pseudomonadota bacterium]